MLGSLEQTRYNLNRHAAAVYAVLSAGYLLSLLAFFRLNLYLGLSLFLAYTFLVGSYYYPNSQYEKNGLTFTLAYSLMWLPIRCYTLSLFITRKKIW